MMGSSAHFHKNRVIINNIKKTGRDLTNEWLIKNRRPFNVAQFYSPRFDKIGHLRWRKTRERGVDERVDSESFNSTTPLLSVFCIIIFLLLYVSPLSPFLFICTSSLSHSVLPLSSEHPFPLIHLFFRFNFSPILMKFSPPFSRPLKKFFCYILFQNKKEETFKPKNTFLLFPHFLFRTSFFENYLLSSRQQCFIILGNKYFGNFSKEHFYLFFSKKLKFKRTTSLFSPF